MNINVEQVSRTIQVNQNNNDIKVKRVFRDIDVHSVGRRGPQGIQGNTGATGATGPQGDPGVVQSLTATKNITVDDTDPANPIVGTNFLTTVSSTQPLSPSVGDVWLQIP